MAVLSADHPAEIHVLVSAELNKLLSSEFFQHSKQADRLLRYLVQHSLEDREDALRERAIGREVFGREEKYDTNSDSIVRVRANDLRKRLDRYYLNEGATPAVRLSIPPGSYRVGFQVLEPEPPNATKPVAPVPQRHRFAWLRRISLPYAGLLVALAITSGWALLQNRQLNHRLMGSKDSPALSLLWSPIFAQAGPVQFVLADSNLSLFQDLVRKPVSLDAYLRRRYLSESPDADRDALEMLMSRHYTSLADVEILRRTMLVGGIDGSRIEVHYAREFSAENLKKGNSILIGARYSDPWVELLENRMDFHFLHDESSMPPRILNVNPKPGEPRQYQISERAENARESFAVVAFLPNLTNRGHVLILEGISMEGTLAAGELATDDDAFAQVVKLLNIGSGGALPHFEVLLRTEIMGNAVHSLKIVSVHRHKG